MRFVVALILVLASTAAMAEPLRQTLEGALRRSQHHVLRRGGPQHRTRSHQWRHYHGLRPNGSAERNDQSEQVTASTQDTKSIR